jgi:hypothetical protein
MTTITTPGGDLIEVVPDDDFIDVFDIAPNDFRLWAPRQSVLSALWHEGVIRDSSGSCTAALHRRAGRYGYNASQVGVTSLLNSKMMRAVLERDVDGKRTKRIQLVRLPENYVARLRGTKSKAVPPNPKMVEFAKTLSFGPPEPVPEPPTEDVAAAVARELLAEVVRIVTARPDPLNDKEVKERLANSLAYTEKLRKELRETGDELRAVKLERDSLRQGLKLMEANFDKALGDNRRVIDEEVRKQTARLMQARPTTTGGDDAD